ncbi:MAG: hypothetical protein NT007_13995 [Candidatus Kapabacteria bacterium]|nr:hypothetical protein [Candidatus Kapabacteria bacterium]
MYYKKVISTVIIAALTMLGAISLFAQANQNNKLSKDQAQQMLQNTGLHFIENKGQVKDARGNKQNDVLYLAETNGMKIYFRRNSISYVLHQTEQQDTTIATDNKKQDKPSLPKVNLFRYDMEFVGANSQTKITPFNEQEGYFNYLIGNESDHIKGTKSYKKLVYHEIYPKIDIAFYEGAQ